VNHHIRTDRRQLLVAGTSALGLASVGAPVIAQQRTRIRVGYVDTLAVTGQIWTGVHRGHWAKEGIEFDPVKFNTGLELFNAMIGGSLDMLSTGAVISNFPARGQGKAFLINNIEFATAQLWVREDQGVKSWPISRERRSPPRWARPPMCLPTPPCVPTGLIPQRMWNSSIRGCRSR